MLIYNTQIRRSHGQEIKFKNLKPLLFIALFVCGCQTFAQRNSNASYKRFGFQAGMNIANMNFNKGEPTPIAPIDASWKSGITIGILVHIPLAKSLFLQPEYSYTQRRGADKSTATNYSIDYFSLPVLLNYRISSRFNLLAGAQAELLIHANAYNNGITSNITHDTEERSIGLTGGFEVHLIKSFFISARYLQGLNHIGIGQRSNVKEFKYEIVNVSLGTEF